MALGSLPLDLDGQDTEQKNLDRGTGRVPEDESRRGDSRKSGDNEKESVEWAHLTFILP